MNLFIRNHWPTLFWVAVVFVLAVMIRLPSLYESFWVDELHTAWCIWGDLSQVDERAAAGNQTPLYFQLMWFWKAIVGESELALRMSSVLAVAVACVLLVVGVQQTTKSLAAGVLAGLVLAIETNSIYFGTEFRPYAFVMLLSVVATWVAVNLLGSESRIGRANLRLIFVVAVGLATLLHPTAIVTLGLLAIVVLAGSYLQSGLQYKLQISDLISLIVIAAVAFALFNSTLGASWEDRSRWAAFGKVSQWGELWGIWPWLTLAIAPAFSWLAGRGSRTGREIVCAHLPMLVALIATVLFFVASYCDWVPLWHRRYFIAVLPMLAWSAGACAMLVLPANPGDVTRRIGWAIVVVLAGALFWQQGVWKQFQVTQTWGEARGEDWRGAVSCVNERRGQSRMLFVDAGLIERAEQYFTLPQCFEQVQRDYFRFPVLGPYELDVMAGAFSQVDGGRIVSSDSDKQIWLISRSGGTHVENWAMQQFGEQTKIERHYYGRVVVYNIYRNQKK